MFTLWRLAGRPEALSVPVVMGGLLILLVGGGNVSVVQARPGGLPDTSRGFWADWSGGLDSAETERCRGRGGGHESTETDSLPRSAALRPRRVSVPASSPSRPPPHFGEALLGSTLGVAVGGTLGVLMIQAAADDAVWDRREDQCSYRYDSCYVQLQRLGIGLLGVGFVAGGGPFGAAQRLDRGGVSVYAPAVIGELLLGGLGYALGRKLSRTERGAMLWGLAVGAPLGAVGAAGGAMLGTSTSPSDGGGGVRYREGDWRLAMPSVRVQPPLATDRFTVHVSLLSVRL